MAEETEAPKAAVDGTGESSPTDQDFSVTAEMMVHELDDEATLEEEELLADRDEDFSDELEDLQKEGDMPLETLLAMYGYSDDNNPDANVDVPLDEIKPEPLPPLDGTEDGQLHEPVPTSVEGRLPLVDPPQEITAPPTLDENALSPPSPNSAPSLPVSHGNNNYFPENQRITRGLAATYGFFHPCESSSSDDDEDYTPEDWKKEIQIGPEHQAEVPDTTGPNYEEVEYEGDDKCLWNPQRIPESEVQQYYNCVCQPPGLEGIKRLEVCRDDEQALYLLFQCEYIVDAAIRKRRAQTSPQAEVALWSEDECRDFESGLRIYGKDFRQIQHNKVSGRSVGEIVQFYYLWKKTERHDAFACQSRLAKKKYAFHPGITDYMDRFLDENESAASSRASSPHHFAGRPRPAMNGVAPTTVQGPVQAPGTVQQTVAIPTASQHTTVVISGAGISSVTPSNGVQLGQPNNTQGGQLAQQYVPTSVIVASQDRAEPPQKKPRMDLQNRPKLISSKPPPLKPIAMSDFRSTNMLTAGPTKPIHISLSSSSPSPSPSSHERSFGSNHMPNLTTPESPLYTQNN